MAFKRWLDEPGKESSEEYILDYLKYNHNRIHIKYGYELLKSLHPDKDSVIAELGCNGHYSLNLFNKLGLTKIIAADYDISFLEGIKEYTALPEEIYNIDFNDPLPLNDESVDIVNTLEVVEHIVKAESYIKEVYRVLKKSGHLVISTPNHSFYISRWRAIKGDRLGMEALHYRFFTKDHFEEILHESGFEIINSLLLLTPGARS
jgi:SAM-dependent methyltransferase